MAGLSRRQFLGTAALAGMMALPRRKALGNVLGANGKTRVAVAGLHGRGSAHVDAYAKMDDVEIAYLVDVDSTQFAKYLKSLAEGKKTKPKCVADIRKVLADKSIDAISIATPNHWHSLMTIWACQAGKHVYVEKPMCHNALEGQIAVEAAKKYKRVVQHGTQQRSDPTWEQAMAAVHSGKLGKLQLVRGLCYKAGSPGKESTRGDIGFAPIKDPPSELNFDLWLGPAPKQPYHANLVPYRWHWFWDFGNGDLGNQGVHQMDQGHAALPKGSKFPRSVVSAGGRFKYKDQGQTPNSIISIFDYDGIPFIFEVRGLESPQLKDVGVGNIIVLEEGEIRGGGGKPKFFPRENGKISDKAAPMPEVEYHVEPGGPFRNFIDAVKADDPKKQNAFVEKGYYPSVLCHLGNASYLAGSVSKFDKKKQVFEGNPAASEAFGRMEEYLVANGLKLEETEYMLGKHLTLPDPQTWKTNDRKANGILAGTHQYRKGFELPKEFIAKMS